MTRINNTPTKFKTLTNNTKKIPRPGDAWLCFCSPPHKRPAKKQRYLNKLHTNKPSNQLSKASKTIIKQKQWNMSNCWLLYTSDTKDHALWWKIPEGAPEGRQAGGPRRECLSPLCVSTDFWALRQSYLIPQVCPIRILSKSLVHSQSTRHLKTPFATHAWGRR